MTTIQPFPLDQIVRLSRRHLHVVRFLRSQIGPSAEQAFRTFTKSSDRNHRSLHIGMIWSCKYEDVKRVSEQGTITTFLVGPDRNRALLILDSTLLSAVFAILLQSEPPPLSGKPTPAEQGLVLYGIADLLGELGQDCSWSIRLETSSRPLDAEDITEQDDWIGIEAHATINGQRGMAWLFIADHLPPTPFAFPKPASQPVDRLKGAALSLSVAGGMFYLSLSEIRELHIDDVVLFPMCPSTKEPMDALILVGSGSLPATIEGSRVTITKLFRKQGFPMKSTEESEHKEALAEELPIEVVVELGRLNLTGAQVLELMPGDVLTLDRPTNATVNLRVGSRLVARGELVDVEGEAGVRIVELYD